MNLVAVSILFGVFGSATAYSGFPFEVNACSIITTFVLATISLMILFGVQDQGKEVRKKMVDGLYLLVIALGLPTFCFFFHAYAKAEDDVLTAWVTNQTR